MMSGLLGCAKVGGLDEDRNGATCLESTSLLWQADEQIKTDTGRERKVWLSTLGLAVLCPMMGHWGICKWNNSMSCTYLEVHPSSATRASWSCRRS